MSRVFRDPDDDSIARRIDEKRRRRGRAGPEDRHEVGMRGEVCEERCAALVRDPGNGGAVQRIDDGERASSEARRA